MDGWYRDQKKKCKGSFTKFLVYNAQPVTSAKRGTSQNASDSTKTTSESLTYSAVHWPNIVKRLATRFALGVLGTETNYSQRILLETSKENIAVGCEMLRMLSMTQPGRFPVLLHSSCARRSYPLHASFSLLCVLSQQDFSRAVSAWSAYKSVAAVLSRGACLRAEPGA